MLSEIDAFFLPDTVGTDYRTQHTKTTIGIQEIDLDHRRLGYFHNSSYHELGDADFVGLCSGWIQPPDPTFMPFFAELVRTKRVVRHEPRDLAQRSVAFLRKHLARRPDANPIPSFARDFKNDVEKLKGEGLGAYHTYAFATIRQLGAAFEFGALYLRWLEKNGEKDLEPAAKAFDGISATAKSLILKTARAVGAKKDVDLSAMLSEIETQWDAGMGHLVKRYGAP